MMKNEDKLLQQFFADNRQEIADKGFSRQVMRNLPIRSRSQRLSRLWTSFCFTLALVLFITLDGLQLILGTLRETFATAVRNEAIELDSKSLIIVGAVLIFLIYRKICTLA